MKTKAYNQTPINKLSLILIVMILLGVFNTISSLDTVASEPGKGEYTISKSEMTLPLIPEYKLMAKADSSNKNIYFIGKPIAFVTEEINNVSEKIFYSQIQLPGGVSKKTIDPCYKNTFNSILNICFLTPDKGEVMDNDEPVQLFDNGKIC